MSSTPAHPPPTSGSHRRPPVLINVSPFTPNWPPALAVSGPRSRRRLHAGVNTTPLPRNWPQLVVWIALDAAFLLLGAITAFVAFAWLPSPSEASPDSTKFARTLILSRMDLIAALTLGATMCAIFIFSLPAILQSKFRTGRLFAFNFLLIIAGLLVIVAGSIIWWRTLRERDTFGRIWFEVGEAGQAVLQDNFSCCGYWNLTEAVPSSFCTGALSDTPLKSCVDPITAYADGTLNKLFTLIYAYMSIIILLFFATCCVMAERRLRERFHKIDQKRKTLLFA